jgi:23S rRNA pseudouridine1911/1915/1917 synthase
MSGKNYSVGEDADWEESFAAPMRCTVPSELGGMRFDQALARLFPQYSRSRLQAWLKAGHIRLDGHSAEARQAVTGGEDVVLVPPPTPNAIAPKAQRMPLKIVHEDADLIVVDKPPGLVVHPGAGQPDRTLLNALLAHAPGLAGVPRAGIVHRLDKDTSGLLVVAKTPAAQTDLVRQLAARTVKREYAAIVRGDLARAVTIDAPIGRHPTARTTMAVVAAGKPARTHAAPVERFGHATLVRCTLETGRTHQIRVHLAAVGHPLVGDPSYGGRRASPHVPPFPRQALHAARLGLAHPVTRVPMQWTSPLPADLAALLAALRAESA